MRPVLAIPRVLVAAGLIASLGFSGICRCSVEGTAIGSPAHVKHRSDACSCASNSDACCGESQCNCDSHSPQIAKTLAVPDRTHDEAVLLAQAPALFDVGTAAAKPLQFDIYSACLPSFIANLIAQGTRLNI